jgi:hypothetical protein
MTPERLEKSHRHKQITMRITRSLRTKPLFQCEAGKGQRIYVLIVTEYAQNVT